jgi:hypothetical protein
MFPEFRSISKKIYDNIVSKTPNEVAKRSVFIRAISGAGTGLILESNPNIPLFENTNPLLGKASVYGGKNFSGTMGIDWTGKYINPTLGRGLRPNPIITMLHVQEGKDQISREGTLNITCFSLEQLEKVQKYFMEPGYSLFIEWAWNTDNGQIQLLKPAIGQNFISGKDILSAANTRGLNNDSLRKTREDSNGDYDCYFGFITGGDVKSDGDVFSIQIKMHGVPSLPTWLQSHNQISPINKTTGEVKSNDGADVFIYDEIGGALAQGSTEKILNERRFKNMFNKLPAQRQTQEVLDLMKTSKSGHFINFDAVIKDSLQLRLGISLGELTKAIATGKFKIITGWFDGQLTQLANNTDAQNGQIPKAIYISDDSYIKFSLAIDILNASGNLLDYSISGVPVSVKIDTSDTILPSFPLIYSTKKDKMIITGNIPDFTLYFDNQKMINQTALYEATATNGGTVGTYTNFPEELGSTKLITFNQLTFTPSTSAIKEEPNYWGYINDLYINFDFFKTTITQSNKNIREILEDLVNGMSDAVNSIWNFQIIEKAGSNGVLTFKIVDENWSGLYNNTTREFAHSGMKSPFLEATLDISIPADMANAIILRRNELLSNPNQAIIETSNRKGGDTFFSNTNDQFFNVTKNPNGGQGTVASKTEPNKIYTENLSKLHPLPKPDTTEFGTNLPTSLTDLKNYFEIFTYDDTNLFDVIRNKYFYKYKITNTTDKRVSPLLPIKYTFKTYGISGLDRGNTFNIDGIPKKYAEKGFFQITEYEQEVSNTLWTTTITGEYRQYQ